MFSCVLLRCGDKQDDADVLLAEEATISVQVVSSLGRGVTALHYVVEESRDLLLCIPSTIRSRSGCTQEVKVTGCHFDIENEGRTTLKLAKQEENYPNQAKDLPSYAAIRRGLHSSISPNDTMIYLGRFEGKITLTVHIEFLLRLPLESSSHHILDNNIIAKKLSYSLNYASYAQILDVSHSCSVMDKFDWKFKDESHQMMLVKYDTVHDLHEMDEVPSITIKLSSEGSSQSACCMCLSSGKSSGWVDRTGIDTSRDKIYDGVMIASSRVTPEQLAVVPKNCINNGSNRCVSPSEFVFLVDCSASMNPFIDSVTAALITCIKSLPEGCFFNMIAFGSSFRQLFYKESMEYSRSNARKAVDFANHLKANLGGTELLPSLRWIFKNARKTDMPCQVFIITDVDQVVKDVPYVLRTIRKNRSYSRCHTFGIGPDICRSLVVSIAEAGQGKCVLLQEGDRLQTKVMEVLQESLEPTLMDARVQFHAPPGYSIVESTPKSLGVAFSCQDRLSFAFLKKNSRLSSAPLTNGFDSNSDSAVPATLVGCTVGGKRVKLPIQEAAIPQLNVKQLEELVQLLTQMGHWSKVEEQEILALQANSRKSSVEDDDRGSREGEPSSKRQRLNGDVSIPLQLCSTTELRTDLMSLSLDCGILCSGTYLRGTSKTGRKLMQLVPHRQQQSVTCGVAKRRKNGIISRQQQQKILSDFSPSPSSSSSPSPSFSSPSFSTPSFSSPSSSSSSCSSTSSSSSPVSLVSRSMSSLSALVSKVGSIFQTTPTPMDLDDDGKTLEDEMEIQNLRKTQPSWSHGRDKLRYPQSYYQSSIATSPASSSALHHRKASATSSKSSKRHLLADGTDLSGVVNRRSKPQLSTGHFLTPTSTSHSAPSSFLLCDVPLSAESSCSFSPVLSHHHHHGAASDNSSCTSSNDKEDSVSISDSESDSSLDLESLPNTRQYQGIIQSQLFGGAWPLDRGFYGAIRISKSDIKQLPLTDEHNGQWSPSIQLPNQETGKGVMVPRSRDIDEELKPHFWCTALAVVCFRECYPELEVEWKLIVAKGVDWLKQNLDQCGMELDEVYDTARRVLFRNNTTL